MEDTQDPDIQAWLERIKAYQQAMSTPSVASEVQFRPLAPDEAANLASSWDDYRRQNGLASPGLETLLDMIYLIDAGRQPLYQEAFQNIYRFHSIAFGPEGYLQLGNRTHLENTFSPFQITFEHIEKCPGLLPLFEEARAAGFGYILNLDNVYVAQTRDWLRGNVSSDIVILSMKLKRAISTLPDDNLIKISNPPEDQQIAFFAVGNYIFAIAGSLDAPLVTK